MNSGLIKMQFFIMLFYLHRKNENYKITSQVSFKLFVKLFWQQLFCRTPLKYVFRTQLKIYDGGLFAKIVNVNYFCKKAPFEMFDWVLNTLCLLMVIIYMVLVVSVYILLFQNVSKMQFQDCNVIEDRSFNSFMTEVPIIQKPIH